MAIRAATLLADAERFVQRISWTGLANGDTGSPVKFGPFADRSVQVLGTFGAGGSINIEGSNDGGTTWHVLRDPLGVALTFTAAGIDGVLELPYEIRPNVTAGDGTTNLAVYLLMRAAGR